ncbi:serine hydrolase [Pyxidicoccus caerfyrddinensis]|uniref:serine hydrolase n=1 Tax=Pyxidicoccus caerfyrddinensis TaxID=2709663 RepID=UPI0013DD2D09
MSASLGIMLCAVWLGATQEQGVGAQEASAARAPGPSDPVELGAFLDGVIAAQLKATGTPGATVAVVRNGRVLYSRGHGYADLEQRRPVGDETLFRIGSISKLFTWTAVMQLAEQGRLELDADVNSYLKGFQLPATYPEPITLRHLMSHTAGFEANDVGGLLQDASGLEPLGQVLARDIPARVRPPGVAASYSNYGAALAGLVVEQVSGRPFEVYIEEAILKPLDMRHSTFRQPPPPGLAEKLATGYVQVAGTGWAGREASSTSPRSRMAR